MRRVTPAERRFADRFSDPVGVFLRHSEVFGAPASEQMVQDWLRRAPLPYWIRLVAIMDRSLVWRDTDHDVQASLAERVFTPRDAALVAAALTRDYEFGRPLLFHGHQLRYLLRLVLTTSGVPEGPDDQGFPEEISIGRVLLAVSELLEDPRSGPPTVVLPPALNSERLVDYWSRASNVQSQVFNPRTANTYWALHVEIPRAASRPYEATFHRDDECLEWWRIWDACADLPAATFSYAHRWMAWACWIRAEERDPQPVQCGLGNCMCFHEEEGFVEHLRGQRDDFENAGIDPKEGFALPSSSGDCAVGDEPDDEKLMFLFSVSPPGSKGPLNLPGNHVIRHPNGCADGPRCAGDAAGAHRWDVEPKLHRPVDGARFTTVTIDWAWTDERIVSAVKGLRSIVGTRPQARTGGAPFWNRYGAARTIGLHNLRVAGESVRAWATEEAR